MDSNEDEQLQQSDIPGKLWGVSAKLWGIGELIKFCNGEPSHKQEECSYGLGCILTDLAEELDSVRDVFERPLPDHADS